MANIEIIIGPMFSGKSTELIRLCSRYEYVGKSVLYINHINDTRCHNEVKTHNNIRKEALKTDNLVNVQFLSRIMNFDVVAIDEGQFFNDLFDFIDIIENDDITVIVAGLDGDYKKQPFGDMLNIIPYANKVTKLNALCKCGKSASFSKRITNNKDQVLVGSIDTHVASCEQCFYI
tara:strand:+ start:308 stop:835 length:528 start_codon:yes stop_codon:yes gene_type:complete